MAPISGPSGNDTIQPGAASAGVTGGVPGSTDDVIVGSASRDSIDGGAGTGDIASDENGATGLTASLAAPGSSTGDAAGDVYLGIEALRGSSHAGDTGANRLIGLDGNDTLEGGSGGDDRLTGGIGADTVGYKAASESTALATDVIADFAHAHGDRIDLLAIDARPGLAGDQAFAFLGTAAFTGGGIGAVRTRQDGGDTFVEVDTGDGTADLVIRLTGLVTLVAADVIPGGRGAVPR